METVYDVVRNECLEDMIAEVNRRLRDGWECIGGVMGDPGLFAQAMIKKMPL